MPGPAVYVVVAVVGAVATSYVFKEFIYDPHIAPIIRDWREQRRPRFFRRRFVPATPEYRPHRSPTPSRGPSPIELNTVVTDEWGTSDGIRRRQVNNVLDDGIPNEVEYPLLSPSTPLTRNPPQVLSSFLNEDTLVQPLFSPVALPIPNLATFPTDVDYTASSVNSTPPAQSATSQSNFTSPQLTTSSPFSDVFELAQSQVSEVEILRPGSGSDDEVLSTPSSVTVTDDDYDNDSLGSWHDIRNEITRS